MWWQWGLRWNRLALVVAAWGCRLESRSHAATEYHSSSASVHFCGLCVWQAVRVTSQARLGLPRHVTKHNTDCWGVISEMWTGMESERWWGTEMDTRSWGCQSQWGKKRTFKDASCYILQTKARFFCKNVTERSCAREWRVLPACPSCMQPCGWIISNNYNVSQLGRKSINPCGGFNYFSQCKKLCKDLQHLPFLFMAVPQMRWNSTC